MMLNIIFDISYIGETPFSSNHLLPLKCGVILTVNAFCGVTLNLKATRFQKVQ